MTVNLVSSDTTEAQVPFQVTIPENQTTIVVPVDAVDDFIDDGIQISTILATANGYEFGAAPLMIESVNHAPVLDFISDQFGTVGQEIRFVAQATDLDMPADNLTYRITAGPSGASIDPVSGEFSWTPGSAGVFLVTIQVEDDGKPALVDEQTVILNVSDGELVHPQSVSVLNGTADSTDLLLLQQSDDQYVRLTLNPKTDNLAFPITTEFRTSVDFNSQNLQTFVVESAVDIPDVLQVVRAFNFRTRQFEIVDSQLAQTDDNTVFD